MAASRRGFASRTTRSPAPAAAFSLGRGRPFSAPAGLWHRPRHQVVRDLAAAAAAALLVVVPRDLEEVQEAQEGPLQLHRLPLRPPRPPEDSPRGSQPHLNTALVLCNLLSWCVLLVLLLFVGDEEEGGEVQKGPLQLRRLPLQPRRPPRRPPEDLKSLAAAPRTRRWSCTSCLGVVLLVLLLLVGDEKEGDEVQSLTATANFFSRRRVAPPRHPGAVDFFLRFGRRPATRRPRRWRPETGAGDDGVHGRRRAMAA